MQSILLAQSPWWPPPGASSRQEDFTIAAANPGSCVYSATANGLQLILQQDAYKGGILQIKEGTWWEEGGVRRTVSQLHEVIGFFGGRWLQLITQLLVGLSLLGTCIAQVVASSGNLYSIDKSHSKR